MVSLSCCSTDTTYSQLIARSPLDHELLHSWRRGIYRVDSGSRAILVKGSRCRAVSPEPLPWMQPTSPLAGQNALVSLDHSVSAVEEGTGVLIHIFPTPYNMLVDQNGHIQAHRLYQNPRRRIMHIWRKEDPAMDFQLRDLSTRCVGAKHMSLHDTDCSR